MRSLFLLVALGLMISGCASYTAVTKLDKGKVAVVKNDGFLYGLVHGGPKVFICKATSRGLKDCETKENPR